MRIEVLFKGDLLTPMCHRVLDTVPRNGYWGQKFEIYPAKMILPTFSGKGKWVFRAYFEESPHQLQDETKVTFEGYRNSFMDGTCAFSTCELPWKDVIDIYSIQTSTPNRSIEICTDKGIVELEKWIELQKK